MAWTEFGTNDAQTVKIWGKLTLYDIIQKTWFNRFMGTDEFSIFQRIMDLESSAGDEVKYDLLYNMKSYGVDGDDRLQGVGEESLRYAQDQIRIQQKRLGHRFARMSQQRTIHNLRADGRRKLSERFAQILDSFLAAYLAGTSGDVDALYTNAVASWATASGNSLNAPDAAHLETVGGAMTTDVIDTLVTKAKTFEESGIANMRPAKFEGQETYVLVMHPFAVKSLRTNAGSGVWRTVVQNARERSESNPLFMGALGEWNGVALHEWTRIPRTAATPLVHNLFLGAQAATFAMGNAYDKLDQSKVGKDNFVSWFEDSGEDYGNQKGLAVGSIFGIKKCQFTDPDDAAPVARDFGVIRVDTNETS